MTLITLLIFYLLLPERENYKYNRSLVRKSTSKFPIRFSIFRISNACPPCLRQVQISIIIPFVRFFAPPKKEPKKGVTAKGNYFAPFTFATSCLFYPSVRTQSRCFVHYCICSASFNEYFLERKILRNAILSSYFKLIFTAIFWLKVT